MLTVVLAILAIAFALPAARSKPHDVRSARPGRWPRAGAVTDILEQHAPGAFAITYYPGEAALRDAIRNRDVYGGISFGPDGPPRLLIATGGSPMVAQMLTQIGNGIAQQTGVPLRTEDLAPPTADDPRGAGLAASALPITLAGLLPAIALVLRAQARGVDAVRRRRRVRRGGGLTIAALLRYVFGSIDHNFWGVAAGLTLGMLAAGLSMLGPGLAVRPRRPRGRRAAGVAPGQPAVGPEQRAGDAAERLGHARSVVAAGRHRDVAAVDRLLRRCRRDDRDRGADLLGGRRHGADRHRRCSPG